MSWRQHLELTSQANKYLIHYLHCNGCGKRVSTAYIPIPTDTPDKGLIIRAWIECPECIAKRTDKFIPVEPNKEASLKAFVKAKGGHAGTASIVQQIKEALLLTNDVQTRAAEMLDLSPRALSYYVRKYNLKPNRRGKDESPTDDSHDALSASE